MAELNITLKIYLENVISTVSPEKSKDIIQTEATRLNELHRDTNFNANNFVEFLKRSDIPNEHAKHIIGDSRDTEDVLRIMSKYIAINRANMLYGLLLNTPEAQRDFNEARSILGRIPLQFGETTETEATHDEEPAVSASADHAHRKSRSPAHRETSQLQK